MTDKVFIDTNVLVYAYDRAEPTKQQQALTVLDHLAITKTGVITSQVMAEFFVTVTRKITPPLTTEEAYQRLLNYWQVLHRRGLDRPNYPGSHSWCARSSI